MEFVQHIMVPRLFPAEDTTLKIEDNLRSLGCFGLVVEGVGIR